MSPQPQQQGPTFREQYAFVQWLMQFPALSVMVFLRRDIGYRLVSPLRLIAITGILFVGSVLAQPRNADAQPMFLLVFALCFFILGMFQRIKRWWEFNRAVRQHSYYIGTSRFDFHWLPAFCRRNRRIARLIDPIVCVLIGVAFFPVSHALAVWLIFSGFCLRSYEYIIHQRERNSELDMVDGLIDAERQGQTVAQFETVSNPRPRQQATGIPTGLGPDVREHIKRRSRNN